MTAHLKGRSLSAVEYSRPPRYVLREVALGRGRNCLVQFSRRSKLDMFVAEAAVSQPLCVPSLVEAGAGAAFPAAPHTSCCGTVDPEADPTFVIALSHRPRSNRVFGWPGTQTNIWPLS